MFQTKRLDIVPARMEALIAEYKGRDALSAVLGVRVPLSWPPEYHSEESLTFTISQLQERPQEAEWWLHYFIDREEKALVGMGGYKGPPDAEGLVEIRYSTVTEYRRRGYATEAVHALVEHAFDVALVKKVAAKALPDGHASVGLLGKCGFTLEEEEGEEGMRRYVISRERRPILPRRC